MDRVAAVDLDPLDNVGPRLPTFLLRVFPRVLERCIQSILFARVARSMHMLVVSQCAPPFGREPTPPRTLCLGEQRRLPCPDDVPLALEDRLRLGGDVRSLRRPGFAEDAREREHGS